MALTRSLSLTLSLVVVLTLSFGLAPLDALAQRKLVDPRAIALTPDDLAPGFAVDPDQTSYGPMPGVGVQYQVQMKRPLNRESLLSGPVLVQQIIIRIDEPVPAEEALAGARDGLIERLGFALTSEGPNDGGTVSLVKSQDPIELYAVGFVKNDMVIFTMWGGLDSVVNYPSLLTLAGISSARYDEAMAG